MQKPRSEGISLKHLALALSASCLVFALAHFWRLSDGMIINDDVRQQIYWMQSWLDPAIYPADLLGEYARTYVPWGIKAVYLAASPFVNPVYFSKILTGFLFVFTAGCLFFLGHRLAGNRCAWVAVCLLWLMPFFLDRMSGGLSRGFASPLTAFFLAAWLWRKAGLMGLAIILQALLVPYALPVCAGAALLAWAAGRMGLGGEVVFPVGLRHWAVLAAAILLAAWFSLSLVESGFGPMVTGAEMAGNPEYGPEGRFRILPVPSLFFELGRPWALIGPFKELGLVAGGVALGLFLLAVAFGLRRVDWARARPRLMPLVWLLAASLLMYGAARLLLLKLFIPDRYLIHYLNLAYLLLCALGLSAAPPHRLATGWPAVLLVGLCLSTGAGRLHGLRLYDYTTDAVVCRMVRHTPPGSLIAGPPRLMDNVLTFGRRNVLISFELSHPWSKGYWVRAKTRLLDLFAAYYSADPAALGHLARKYGVTHLIVDRRHFSREFIEGKPFFAPLDGFIRRAAAHGGPFAALQSGGYPRETIDSNRFMLDLRGRGQPSGGGGP